MHHGSDRHLARLLAVPVALLLGLSGCGGGSDDSPASTRGTLKQSRKVVSLPPESFTALLNSETVGQVLLQITGTPKCSIDLHKVEYLTVGARNESTNATGALMVPGGSACPGPYPVLLYAHGTDTGKPFDLASATDRTNPASDEALLIAATYAAQGFIVVAPNYAGYDQSTLGYHPYLVADQQSKDMIDALTSARQVLSSQKIAESGKLFITGYSQGGHVALATHRALQAAGVTVTASTGQSGPYALSALIDGAFGGQPSLGATFFTPLMANAFQQAYGNLYTSASEFYNSTYATGIETLLPNPTLTRQQIFDTGKLPTLALFDTDVAIYPQVADPFKTYYGTTGTGLIRTSYADSLLADLVAHPCPHTTASAPLNCSPGNALRKAAVANDLRNWTPQRPMLLCGGGSDPSVYFASSQLTYGYFIAHLPAASAALVTLVDVDSAIGSSDPFASAKTGFADLKQQTAAAAAAEAAASGADAASQQAAATQAVLVNYHGTLVPPICGVVARGFFQSQL